ncbi:hypothetical protein ACIBIZ_46505 [Nonomuraea spiralis]|nr:hypothetical protein [Nonomuraea sp. WAC 01424]
MAESFARWWREAAVRVQYQPIGQWLPEPDGALARLLRTPYS